MRSRDKSRQERGAALGSKETGIWITGKKTADVTIVGLMVSLNRMEVGKGGKKCALDEIKDLYGFDTAAIVSMADVVECLYNKECNGKVVIDDTLKAAIDAYYEQYGAK